MYNIKDIIRINQEVGETGQMRDSSSLDFALSMSRTKGWLYRLSFCIRSLACDHPFIDGNKRTAYILVALAFEENDRKYDDEKVVAAILRISKKNITDINRIARLLLKC